MKTAFTIFLVSLLTVACAQNSQNGSSSSIGMAAFGDSFTYGEGIGDRQDAYPFLIATSLGLTIDNEAVGGTLVSAKGQVPSILEFNFQKGQIVIFMSGYNDSRGFADSLDYPNKFKDWMTKALNRFESFQVEAYIGNCITTNPGYYNVHNTPTEVADQQDAMCETLANVTRDLIENGNFKHVHFVNTHENVHLTNATTGSDFQHPNEAGQILIEQEFLNIIRNHDL